MIPRRILVDKEANKGDLAVRSESGSTVDKAGLGRYQEKRSDADMIMDDEKGEQGKSDAASMTDGPVSPSMTEGEGTQLVADEAGSGDPAETVTITPADREALTASDLLPPSFWDEDRAVDEATLAGIASQLEAIGTGEGGDADEAASPWWRPWWGGGTRGRWAEVAARV